MSFLLRKNCSSAQSVVVLRLAALLLALWATLEPARAQDPPVLPVGLDAYRMWDHWADQRIGERAYMRSTYDRTGGNVGSDAGNFLFQTDADVSVPLDVEAPGVLCFSRFNHWHGSPWDFILDGKNHVIKETSTDDPAHRKEPALFLPQGLLTEPFDYTWTTTKGADLLWTPMEFTQSLRITYGHTHYGTGYFIYDQFVPGAKLSHPLQSWDNDAPAQDVADLINRSGSDLLPADGSPEAQKMQLSGENGQVTVPKDGAVSVVNLDSGPGVIRAIDISAPTAEALAFGRATLRLTWDDRSQPSIEAPVALFFGAGTLYNRTNAEYLVKAFPVHIRYIGDRVELACCFPMPFFKSAQIELIGNGAAPLDDIKWRVRQTPYTGAPNQVGYFHATFRDHGVPEPGHDLVLLDTQHAEGATDWSGSFVGTSLIFSDQAKLGTLEGDPRFFFDDSQTPQAQGTGTEEWGGGGDYWGGQTMTLPFAGHPTGAPKPEQAQNDEDKIESTYRFLLADLMPFGKRAVLQLEHGGIDDSKEHYRTVTYWYGIPAPSLIKTDAFQVGDESSEKAHGYNSPDASAPYSITSIYDLGVDTFHGQVIYSPTTDQGRKTTGTSEFTVKVDPHNLGVMLRRKLDYSFPNQRAEVSVADASPSAGNSPPNWQPAGVWYLAGSNTVVHSLPKEELGAAEHNIVVSNRRFRDDEFLLPRDLTAGRTAIRIQVKFTPVHVPLFPGNPEPELAWSEIHYDVYSYVMPHFTINEPAAAPHAL
jgi:hypothetical protein